MMQLRWPPLVACLFVATSASAVAPQRTFAASYGSDTNPCSLAEPCRGFQAAINAVAAGGEVVALDSAGYGAMQINKSVSVIVPPGVHAGLSPGTGIPIPGAAGESAVVLVDIQDTDVVVLRGIDVNHQGTVTGGIEWVSAHGGTLHVENAVVNGFPKEGVYVQAPAAKLIVSDSVLRNNDVGIDAGSAGQSIFADRVRIENSAYGVRVLGNNVARLSNSWIINSATYGVAAEGLSAKATISLDHCSLIGNSKAFLLSSPSAGAILQVADSSILGGGYPFKTGVTGAYSYGNNTLDLVAVFDGTVPPQ